MTNAPTDDPLSEDFIRERMTGVQVPLLLLAGFVGGREWTDLPISTAAIVSAMMVAGEAIRFVWAWRARRRWMRRGGGTS